MGCKKSHKEVFRIVTAIIAVILLLFWVGLAFYSINRITAEDRTISTETKFIAHRGYSTRYMENTIEAFNAACSSSFFAGVETDVWQTQDGIFVCSHNVNPFVDKTINITTSNFDDIKDLPLDTSQVTNDINKTKTYYICTFKDYLIACLVSSKYTLIEIKQDLNSQQIDELLTLTKGKVAYKNVFIGSFNKKTIELVHKKAPYYKVLLFTNKACKSNLYAFLGYNIGVSQYSLKAKAVNTAHKNDSYAFAYTIENKEQLSLMESIGVDFVICDGVLA